jgi:DNA-directed RNA polymerase specialized sigma24 family protein
MSEDADIREPLDPQDANATIDRLMVRHALAQLSAEDLQIPEGTVNSRLHCGLRALRRSLQDGR